MTVFDVVSVSGGKDSDETLRQALARFPKERVLPIYGDTGNEHEAVGEQYSLIPDDDTPGCKSAYGLCE